MRTPSFPRLLVSSCLALTLAWSGGCAVAGVDDPPGVSWPGDDYASPVDEAVTDVASSTPDAGAATGATNGGAPETASVANDMTPLPAPDGGLTGPSVDIPPMAADPWTPTPTNTGDAGAVEPSTPGASVSETTPADLTGNTGVTPVTEDAVGDAAAGSTTTSTSGDTFSADVNTCDPDQCRCRFLTPCCNERGTCGCGWFGVTCNH